MGVIELLDGFYIQDVISEICNHYGFDAQAQIAVEECAELIKAICKRQRKFARSKRAEYQDSPERSAIIEELADETDRGGTCGKWEKIAGRRSGQRRRFMFFRSEWRSSAAQLPDMPAIV